MNARPATPREYERCRNRGAFAATRVALPCFGVAFALWLAACAPTYNWREIREENGAFQVMLPAKPVSMAHAIDLDGLHVTMTMVGARVDETMFTVGSVVLPDARADTRERATAAMRAAMVRNLRGHETSTDSVEVPVVDASGRSIGRAPAARIEVEGRIGEQPAHMTATFVADGDRAWQAVMIARSPDVEAARFFHDSLRITR